MKSTGGWVRGVPTKCEECVKACYDMVLKHVSNFKINVPRECVLPETELDFIN